MKILHTVEFYSPSVGGAQEVVKQISERLAARGHQVTVATTNLKRQSRNINGVQIEEFDVAGNAVRGLTGETERYQDFLKRGNFDIMMNYAAQQWATDLVYPILDQIPYKKVQIPCGFSGLYQPEYADYFANLPEILRKYDHLIFHADDYRDTNFARQNQITHWTLIPNGASQEEFSKIDPTFRQRYGIPENAVLLLTVGSHTGSKGHRLALDSLRKIKQKPVVLVIVGNPVSHFDILQSIKIQFQILKDSLTSILRAVVKMYGKEALGRIFDLFILILFGGPAMYGCVQDCRAQKNFINLISGSRKRVLLLNPPRADVVAAYHATDLFIFGSNVEYSPLVLFEAMASRTPFLTLSCGNAAEIVAWSNGGRLAATIQTQHGNVGSDAKTFAWEIEDMLNNVTERAKLAENGYNAWNSQFTWEKITDKYEKLYKQLLEQ